MQRHSRAGRTATWAFLAFAFAIPLCRAADTSLIGHWLFDQNHLKGHVINAAKGGPNATINGPVSLNINDGPHALMLDGRQNSVVIARDIAQARMPLHQLTAEAWVAIAKPQEWGGIIGAIQDNGDFERGWLLGYMRSNFSVGLASAGAGRITYLKAPSAFEPGRWYHVAGTYDGKLLKIFVNGKLEDSSTEQSGDISYPPKASFEIGAYRDDDEFYPSAGLIHEALVYSRALTDLEVQARYEATKHYFPESSSTVKPYRVATGPFVEWQSPTTIRINWSTEQPTASILEFVEPGRKAKRYEDVQPRQSHAVDIPNIRPESTYSYRIIASDTTQLNAATRTYKFDSTFNYTLPPVPVRPSPYRADELSTLYENAARRILKESGVRQGYALVLGAGEGRLAYELARQSHLKIIAVEEIAATADAARRALDQAGLYGVRVSVHHGPLARLPYGNYFANLIVSDDLLSAGRLPGSAAELFRCLRPNGGVAMLGQPKGVIGKKIGRSELETWLKQGDMTDVRIDMDDGLWASVRRGALPGAGEWTHQYGGADNSACSQDELVQGELSVLWWGEPGPRPMPDRGPRNPTPVSANGRMYVQGDRMLFGMDAYNGTILWSLAAPELRRANLPRDSSNMAASEDYLYIASGEYATGINGQTGQRDFQFKVPGSTSDRPRDWGYLASVGDTLLGSAVKKGSAYLGDDGEWYDGTSANEVSQVTSDSLFALDRRQGSPKWIYTNGTILNATVTVGDGAVYFIESRNSAARDSQSGRLNREVFTNQTLVALDLSTGRKLWEQPVDLSQSKRMLYLAYGQNTLTVVGSSEKDYHVWAFDAPSPKARDEATPLIPGGRQLWEQHYPMARDHHGGALQHPVIVRGTLYSEMRSFDLRTGKQLRTDLPERRGCGTMAAAMNSFFFRHYYHGMWDLKSDRRTQFEGIRGGCWISMIPSGGLVLAPESSAGCSCTDAIQTSVAYVPRTPASTSRSGTK